MSVQVNIAFQGEDEVPSLSITFPKEFVNLNDEIPQEEHVEIGKKLHASAYSKAVFAGRDMPVGNYPKTYSVNATEGPAQLSRKPHVNYTPTEIDNFFTAVSTGETNELFKAAFAKITELAPTVDYSVKEFFRMTLKFGIFSFFGREGLSFSLDDSEKVIKVVMNFIDPSHDEPDIIKYELENGTEPPVIYQNQKYVTIAFNKETGVVAKCELANRYSNSIWVWNCRSSHLIFTHYGRISYNHTIKMYYESISTNVFFSNNGNHPIKREDIFTKNKAVRVVNYTDPIKETITVDAECFYSLRKEQEIKRRRFERKRLEAEAVARIVLAEKKASKKASKKAFKKASKQAPTPVPE